MHFARTLLVPVLLIGGLVEVASAQHKYIFPQFAFGAGWESTLMVQASATPTTCTFSAQGRFLTMRNPFAENSLSGTSIPLTFGMNGWTILKTATPLGMEVSSGMAVLDCSEEVSANTLFSLEVGGSLVAEAVVEPAEEIVSGESVAQFLADHRDGARFGVAVANPSNQPIDVSVAVADLDGQQIAETTVNVPAKASQAFFVDALVTIPTGHTGQVLIGPSNNPGPSVYVVGLRFTGPVFTTIPATVFQQTTEPPPPPPPTLTPEPGDSALVVTKFSVSNSNPIAGSTLTLSATVRNNGTGGSAGVLLDYSVSVGKSGRGAARTLLAPLAASESIDDSVVVRVPSAGTYTYHATVRDSAAPRSSEHDSRKIVVTVEQQTPDDPSIDPRFEDAFWQEFVFGQFSKPNTIDHQVIQVLNTTSPNVYIYTGLGHQVIPDEHLDIIREAIPSAAEQLTGQRYSGRIESGTEHLGERLGWITVRYFTDADRYGSCGFSGVGTDPNAIFINHDCVKRRGVNAIAYLKNTFVHEFGHAMGFRHVLSANAVMADLGNLADTFSAREQFHAQLAYKIGRGARYCGWPFSASCLSR